MNIRRTVFWLSFAIVLVLIVWGLIVAMNKPPQEIAPKIGTPAPISLSDHVSTASATPITLIEYSDFQCPACGHYYPFVTRLLDEASGTIRLVYRHRPLNDIGSDGKILHPNAFIAAQASEAASLQGNFWGMYHLLFQKQTDWAELPDPHSVFEGYAQTLGLDVARFKADIDATSTKEIVQRAKDEAVSIGVNSTPTFIVNGKAIVNPNTYEEFKSKIEAAASGGAR